MFQNPMELPVKAMQDNFEIATAKPKRPDRFE